MDASLRGNVAWFNTQKGFGFIANAEGPDVFVHIKDVMRSGLTWLAPGQSVAFEIGDRNGRPCAQNLRLLREIA